MAKKGSDSWRDVIEGGRSHRLVHNLGSKAVYVSLTSPEGHSVFGAVTIANDNTIVVRPGWSRDGQWVDYRGKVVVRVSLS